MEDCESVAGERSAQKKKKKVRAATRRFFRRGKSGGTGDLPKWPLFVTAVLGPTSLMGLSRKLAS